MKRLLFVLLILTTACASREDLEKPFAYFFDFEVEINRLTALNPTVDKIVTFDGKTEKVTGKINWKAELKPFKDADINTTAMRDRYEMTVEESAEGKHVSYQATGEKEKIRKVDLIYQGDEVKKLNILSKSDELLTESIQELEYVPNEYYQVEVKQKVDMLFKTSMKVRGEFKSAKKAMWQANLDLGEEKLPFNFMLSESGESINMELVNGDEHIPVREIERRGDSIFISLPYFHSEIRGRFNRDAMEGYWHNYSRRDYKIPFYAKKGIHQRFPSSPEKNKQNAAGKWEVTFSPGPDSYKAIGMFEQEGDRLTGTFMTETGDYRYLEGTVQNNQILLSTFDGAHAFLFKAELDEKGEMKGKFWSGIHWTEDWTAVRNESFELTHPDSLTYLKEGYSSLEFEFPDLDGNMVSLKDPRFQNKVVIVELMGTWCPNCMDGTRFLNGLNDKYKEDGLEIVALAFEVSPEFEDAKKRILKHQKDLDANFDFLIAGQASKKEASDKLPMLNSISSFPTTIYIDRNGKVRRIFTGIYGPGTGKYNQTYNKGLEEFVEKLLMD